MRCLCAKQRTGCCGGSSDVIPLYTVTPLQGMQNTLAQLGSSATVNLVVVAPDNSNLAAVVDAASKADVVVIMAGTLAEEGQDRLSISLDGGDYMNTTGTYINQNQNQNAMITTVLAANPTKTVVVLKDNASVLLPWIDQVPAVLEAWFPGQEDGNIVANLLFGTVNPSGKLPVTFPKNDGDWPANTPTQFPGIMVNGKPTVTYSEGLNIVQQWNIANDQYKVLVGNSSRNLNLNSTIIVSK
ncbi:glycoside hydrolase family 3 protein [Glaciimonas soli]|uniref:Glycoside hydrolase family 3 C-terminal domain-containing protein n=1 Tax=Glaciimonas soli TaxID=2590999 RepID=A0A843YP42_9BURK|nr:glycoside hydrolase family 3 C-terminal domain-containing protein [Glaciimonas soli]MQQ99071.1 hypothetical protein [Glaciimonas soli]